MLECLTKIIQKVLDSNPRNDLSECLTYIYIATTMSSISLGSRPSPNAFTLHVLIIMQGREHYVPPPHNVMCYGTEATFP